MAVALVALSLNLAGIAYAATGGNFILGHKNTAGKTTTLIGTGAKGAALSVTNDTPGHPAVAFHAFGTAQPFTVTSSTTVSDLSADLLDGLSSSAFQKSSDLVPMDSVVSFGQTKSWDVGPYITLYADCSGTSGNDTFTQRLLNNAPTAGQWTSGEIAAVGATNPGTSETHGGSAGSGQDTQISKETNPSSSTLVGPAVWANVIWRDNSGEVVTAEYSAIAYANYCEITGTLTRAT